MLSKMTSNKGKKHYEGFTLIELVIVITIIAILSSLVIAIYAGFIRNAKEKVCNVNCLQLEKLFVSCIFSFGR